MGGGYRGKNVIVFVGPAGAGKSSLVAAYSAWLSEALGAEVCKMNLDPAAEYIPYEPEFDVRRYIDARRLAVEMGLGPNGAMIAAMDALAGKVDTVIEAVKACEGSFVLVDTPGQMEVFVFRDVAVRLLDAMRRAGERLVVVFVNDAALLKRPEDYAFVALMSVALQARLGVEVVPVINKIDLERDLAVVGDVVSDVELVTKKLEGAGLYGELLAELLSIVWRYSKAARVPRLSAKEMVGLEELHRIVHEVACSCGDLT